MAVKTTSQAKEISSSTLRRGMCEICLLLFLLMFMSASVILSLLFFVVGIVAGEKLQMCCRRFSSIRIPHTVWHRSTIFRWLFGGPLLHGERWGNSDNVQKLKVLILHFSLIGPNGFFFFFTRALCWQTACFIITIFFFFFYQDWIISQDPVGNMAPNKWEDLVFDASRSIEPKDQPPKKVVSERIFP